MEIICPIEFYEIWKPVNIDGVIKNYYFVSSFGRVKNIKDQILKPQMINSGYLVYKLYTGNNSSYGSRYKTVLAHRLVKETFQPIFNSDQMTVNHDNLDKTNNFLYNLTWMSQYANNMHKQEALHLYGSNNYQAAFTKDQLKIIMCELNKGTRYKDILSIIGIEDTPNNRDYIGNIKRGKTYQKEIRDILNE